MKMEERKEKEKTFKEGFGPICIAVAMEGWYQADPDKVADDREKWLGEIFLIAFRMMRFVAGFLFGIGYTNEKHEPNPQIISDLAGQALKVDSGALDHYFINMIKGGYTLKDFRSMGKGSAKSEAQVKAIVRANRHPGTPHMYEQVFGDWTHYFRQKGDLICVDVDSGHGGFDCFQLVMKSESHAKEAYHRIAAADEDEEVDIRDLQPE